MAITQPSAQAITILRHIAVGSSYEEILQLHPEITYTDIFEAAREILSLFGVEDTRHTSHTRQQRIWRLRRVYPRAHMPWDEAEMSRLIEMFSNGKSAAQIAAALHRHPGSIRRRLGKLRLASRDRAPRVTIQNID